MREPVARIDLVALDDMYFIHKEFGVEIVIEDGTITEIIKEGECSDGQL